MNSKKEIFCPNCGYNLKSTEQHPFKLGIVQECQNPNCGAKFYKLNNGGEIMLQKVGI